MNEQLYPRPCKLKDKSNRRWHVDYEITYDGGGSNWSGFYRTYIGARIAAWWNVHVASWGGNAILYDNKKE